MPHTDAWREVQPLVHGRYEAVRPIGVGGQGQVWLARCLQTEALVALKSSRDTGARRALAREFQLLETLGSPHIVRPRELLEDVRRTVLSTEYVHGIDVVSYIRCAQPDARLISALDAVGDSDDTGRFIVDRSTPANLTSGARAQRLRGVIAQLARGLSYLHERGWAHGDVKFSNTLVSASGHLVLVDLGAARRVSSRPRSGSRRETDTAAEVQHDMLALGALLRLCLDAARETDVAEYCTTSVHLEAVCRGLLSSESVVRTSSHQLADLLETPLSS